MTCIFLLQYTSSQCVMAVLTYFGCQTVSELDVKKLRKVGENLRLSGVKDMKKDILMKEVGKELLEKHYLRIIDSSKLISRDNLEISKCVT